MQNGHIAHPFCQQQIIWLCPQPKTSNANIFFYLGHKLQPISFAVYTISSTPNICGQCGWRNFSILWSKNSQNQTINFRHQKIMKNSSYEQATSLSVWTSLPGYPSDIKIIKIHPWPNVPCNKQRSKILNQPFWTFGSENFEKKIGACSRNSPSMASGDFRCLT